MSSNESTIADEDGNFSDWIEIYNYGETAIDLEGFGLSDDVSNPLKWVFPSVIINPKEYILVWASDKNQSIKDKELHTNFKIGSGGENIILSTANGTVINESPSIELDTDISYGRQEDGTGSWFYFATATPKLSNTGDALTELPSLNPPTFSHDSGLYSDNFDLVLTTNNQNATIVYTLDGSEPDLDNLSGTTFQYKNEYPVNPGDSFGPFLDETYISYTYNNPINIYDRSSEADKLTIKNTQQFALYTPPNPVRKATIVKAKTFFNGKSSKTISKTFFVWNEGNPYSIPVISLQIQENYLFDYNDGIYTSGVDFDTWRTNKPDNNQAYKPDWNNYARSGRDWEYPLNVEFFEENSLKSVMNINGGFRIHGNNSRTLAIKNLRLYARSDYDTKDAFEHNFFDQQIPNAKLPNNNQFKRLMLRGDGSGGSIAYDVVFSRLMQPIFNGIARLKPAIHFINGEFWGLTIIRDRIDNNHFSLNFDLDPDNIVIVDCKAGNCGIDEGDNDDYKTFIDMRDFIIENNMSEQTKYEEAANLLDMDSFINHLVIEIYAANDSYERYFWKVRTNEDGNEFGDGKWRLTVQDFEASLKDNINWLEHWADISRSDNQSLLGNLLENETFKNKFINRFADVLNTAFLSDRFNSIVNETFNEVAPYLSEDQNRYPREDFYKQNEKENLLDWGTNNPDNQRQQIKDFFNISETVNLNINVTNSQAGYVKINTLTLKESTTGVNANPYPWSGTYFKEIPVTIEATPLDGYTFSHWSGDANGTNSTLTITPNSDLEIVANFSPIENYQHLIYFWLMDSSIENDTPLERIESTYSRNGLTANLNYNSCLEGYPFTDTDENWRKASLERKNDPTELNYKPLANNSLSFEEDFMKGVQVKQPFKSGNLENTIELNFSTLNFKNIKLSFAVKTDGAANALLIDYWKENQWVSTNLNNSNFPITDDFNIVEIDFSNVSQANNNSNFKVRIRFDGDNMTEEDKKEVIFNNIAIEGAEDVLSSKNFELSNFTIYPNPTEKNITIKSVSTIDKIIIYNIYGKKITEKVANSLECDISLENFAKGVYLLKVISANAEKTIKVLKN